MVRGSKYVPSRTAYSEVGVILGSIRSEWPNCKWISEYVWLRPVEYYMKTDILIFPIRFKTYKRLPPTMKSSAEFCPWRYILPQCFSCDWFNFNMHYSSKYFVLIIKLYGIKWASLSSNVWSSKSKRKRPYSFCLDSLVAFRSFGAPKGAYAPKKVIQITIYTKSITVVGVGMWDTS